MFFGKAQIENTQKDYEKIRNPVEFFLSFFGFLVLFN
jgi:hypothetical protein